MLDHGKCRGRQRVDAGGKTRPRVLMVGTSLSGRGGISAVVQALRAGGLFERERIMYVATHVDGGKLAKCGAALRGVAQAAITCLLARPAIVHVHAASHASFVRKSLVLLLARRCGARTICHLHGGAFRHFAGEEAGPLLRRWIRHTLEASSRVIALSPAWAGFVRAFAPRAQVAVVPNPVLPNPVLPDLVLPDSVPPDPVLPNPVLPDVGLPNPEPLTPAPRNAGPPGLAPPNPVLTSSVLPKPVLPNPARPNAAPPNTTLPDSSGQTARPLPRAAPGEPGRILFLGRICAAKGVDELLDACARLAPRAPALHLVLGGDGELEWARRRADELGIGARVALPGWLDAEQRARQLARAWLFCLPSHAEGMPMAMLEAMAAGVPVVASSVGAIPDTLTDGVDGLLVPPGNIDALERALGRLLADPMLHVRLACAARGNIERNYTSERVCGRLGALYAQLMQEGCGTLDDRTGERPSRA